MRGGHETVINNDNIKSFVKAYLYKKSYLLPDDLKNKPIGKWDVSRVTDMSELFKEREYFNEDISQWNVSNVTNMAQMFYQAKSFNQPIGEWNVSNVTNMVSMFFGADSFNQPIGEWNVSNVTNMNGMFGKKFNQPIGDWNVSNVTNMGFMFSGAESFNQPIGEWNVSNVTNMGRMFQGARYFNQPIGDWNVSNVTNMLRMFFAAQSFNQPIGEWNVSNVTDMYEMFKGALSFNQNLNKWNIINNIDIGNPFAGSAMVPSNYPNPSSLELLEPIEITSDYLKQLGYSKQAIEFILDKKKMDDDNFISYVGEIEDKTGIDYKDPIYYTLMIDPVQASDGKIYERGSIIEIINSTRISPLTRTQLEKKIISADERRKQINKLINKYLDDKEYEKDRPKRLKTYGRMITRRGQLEPIMEAEALPRRASPSPKQNTFQRNQPLPRVPEPTYLSVPRLVEKSLQKPKTKTRTKRSRSVPPRVPRGGKTRKIKKH